MVEEGLARVHAIAVAGSWIFGSVLYICDHLITKRSCISRFPFESNCRPVLHVIGGPPRIVSRLYVFPAMAVRFHGVDKFLILDSISGTISSYFSSRKIRNDFGN